MIRVLVVGFVMFASQVWADTLLFVSPLRVEIKPNESTAVVTVTNKATTVKKYSVQMLDQAMTAQGVTQTVETFPYSSKRMLRFMPRRIVLEPGQRQVVRIMARRPAELPDGDYHTHILFEEEQTAAVAEVADPSATKVSGTEPPQKGLSMQVGAVYGVAIPVVVQQGNVTSSLQMGEVNIKRNAQGQPTDLLVAFHRTGNAEASAMLAVKNGTTDLITPRRVRVYREVDDVVLTLPLLKAGAEFQGKAEVKLSDGPDAGAKVLQEASVVFP